MAGNTGSDGIQFGLQGGGGTFDLEQDVALGGQNLVDRIVLAARQPNEFTDSIWAGDGLGGPLANLRRNTADDHLAEGRFLLGAQRLVQSCLFRRDLRRAIWLRRLRRRWRRCGCRGQDGLGLAAKELREKRHEKALEADELCQQSTRLHARHS